MWKAVVDPNSSKAYYYHCKVQATSWTKPEQLKNAKGQPMDAPPARKSQPNADAQSQLQAEPKVARVDSPNGEETANAMRTGWSR